MRYTEARMTRYLKESISYLNRNTVDFVDNFDGEEKEPSILPFLAPNLLINGSSGIAVGMACNIPPHNLDDSMELASEYLKSILNGEDMDIEAMIKILKAPDFPTGANIIYDRKEILKAYTEGKGKIVMRASYEMKEDEIIFTDIPYKEKKSSIVTEIDALTRDRINKDKVTIKAKLPEVRQVLDLSNKDGMCISVKLKKGANANRVLQNIFKYTNMQSSFGYNFIAIVNGQPKKLNLKQYMDYFLEHACEVIRRKTNFDLAKYKNRFEIVNAILVASQADNFDRVSEIIRFEEDSVSVLMNEFGFTQKQAEYIDDIKLKALGRASSEKLENEKLELSKNIEHCNLVLNNDSELIEEVLKEFSDFRAKFAKPRKTKIIYNHDSSFNEEDLIKDENVIITYTSDSIIKSVLDEFKTQNRGTKGSNSNIKDSEIITNIMSCSTKDTILFFTSTGRCHTLKAYNLPIQKKDNKGKHINNYIDLIENEQIVSMITLHHEEDKTDKSILFVTRKGLVKNLSLDSLSSRGKCTNVIKFNDDDELVDAKLLNPTDGVMLITKKGMSITFDLDNIRTMGKTAMGVKGIKTKGKDTVVAMLVINQDGNVLTITEKGIGKQTSIQEYKVQARGGTGVITHKITDKTGNIVSALYVQNDTELFVISKNGKIIKLNANNISTISRSSSGVKLINLDEGDSISTVGISNSKEEEEQQEEVDVQQ